MATDAESSCRWCGLDDSQAIVAALDELLSRAWAYDNGCLGGAAAAAPPRPVAAMPAIGGGGPCAKRATRAIARAVLPF